MTSSPHDPHQPTQPDDSSSGEATIWDTIDRARQWLDDTNGTDRAELTMRILKIAEEYGEVSTAWAGVSGQNPRKGVTSTVQDVAAELGDVAFTAMVAAASLGFDPRTVLAEVAAKVNSRFAFTDADTSERR
jgi:NTP pyrophosphatase (non-canonical NTP hydrolase)